MNRHPSINVIIPTLNEEKALEDCLKPILRQDYPKGKLKITIVDGGSIDSTVKIAKKYGCQILFNEEKLAEPGFYKAVINSDCDLCCAFAADNIIVNYKDFFIKMIKPFLKKHVTGAFPLITISKNEPSINKYINYSSEPFSEFLYGKACNIRTFKDVYGIKYENRDYVIYDFQSSDFPLLALAQGFMVDKKKFKWDSRTKLSDMRPIIDIIKRDEDMAYVRTAKVFHYQVMSLRLFIKKFQWRVKNNLTRIKMAGIDTRKDFKTKRCLWGMYSLSIILPFLYSLYRIIQTKRGFYVYHFITNSILLFLIPYVFLKLKLGKTQKTYK